MQIHFLHGTETGTAEFLCDDLKAALPDGWQGTISSLDDVDPSALRSDTFYVLVVSTFGSGDLPGTAVLFYETLRQSKPDLSSIRFAIFGLGDLTFGETFNQGSEKVMDQMLACGAKMTGERVRFDSSSADMPEDVAVPWLQQLLAQMASA